MAYRNTFFRWLFLYSLTFGLTYVLKLFTYLCPEILLKPLIPPSLMHRPLPLSASSPAGRIKSEEKIHPWRDSGGCCGLIRCGAL